jgi:hypothetical protein
MWANSKKEIEIPPVEVCSILKGLSSFLGSLKGKTFARRMPCSRKIKMTSPQSLWGGH